MKLDFKRNRGVVMIFTAGVLAIIAALGTAYFAMAQSMTTAAVRYADMVRADMLARAGISDAITRLREQAFNKTEDPSDPWFMTNYLNGLSSRISYAATDGSGNTLPYSNAMGNTLVENGDRYILQISDAAGKININAGDNLAVILDNLCRLVGPPLVAANQDALQPRRWAVEGANGALFSNSDNVADTETQRDYCYRPGADRRPIVDSSGVAVFGDGYAIAGYRARAGRYASVADIRRALTYIERNGNGWPDDPLEEFEVESKYAAIKNYLTTSSWVDTTTVGVGKFEWAATTTVTLPHIRNVVDGSLETDVTCQILIDRDKSWVADDPINDPKNTRGSLRGSYLSIMNGHGAGQLRRILSNGADWIALRAYPSYPDESLEILPGPISSYMIITREDALLEAVQDPSGVTLCHLPRTHNGNPPYVDGTLVDDPDIDYSIDPLCIHRAPVNINTASDKVLAALFMGLNVQHGHPMAVGTDADRDTVRAQWYTIPDPNDQEPYLLTFNGLKRVPQNSGKVVFDRPRPVEAISPEYDYIDNNGAHALLNEAQELAFRIIFARQATDWDGNALPNDPLTGYPRGPFKSWDEIYFRVIKPWDDARKTLPGKMSVARMIMANFNNNTDILKFNPNIEWIDRWGRNYTEMEPVMLFDTTQTPPVALWVPGDTKNMWDYNGVTRAGRAKGAYYIRSLRYKSDELIDKTDLNRSTTEFSFDSGGFFHVSAAGQVMGPFGLVAERRFDVLLKLYDVWRESSQQQFVSGTISQATGGLGTTTSGQITRDATNVNSRLALATLPEPVVPLGYVHPNSSSLSDVVGGINDAWGNTKNAQTPDVVANRILPAQYDGQLVLATNQMDTSDGTTFLASFIGDLDTTTCSGNGREQAKVPVNKKIRVLDTFSLLGLLNDRQVDFDPLNTDNTANGNIQTITLDQFNTFPVSNVNQWMGPLNKSNYWENCTCRMGDLRVDGVYLGNVGCSGKDATMKYLQENNFQLRTANQATICMWFKPNWRGNDGREHEFFNACNVGTGFGARYCTISKHGRFSWAIPENGGGDNSVACSGGKHVGPDDLTCNVEDKYDKDVKTYLHGGLTYVNVTNTRESPAFHVQPFRWGFVGGRMTRLNSGDNTPEYSGYWCNESADGLAARDKTINDMIRPFIDSARDPEGTSFNTRYFWKQQNTASFSEFDIGNANRQSAAWGWTDGGQDDTEAVFSANNLNQRGAAGSSSKWLYRAGPIDGTLAVVDEYRISSNFWTSTEINKWQTMSRYYLPADPTDATQCPTFTSQTLLQSLRGSDKTVAAVPEYVTLARVSWNVFTPRFMHANRAMSAARTRNEYVKQVSTAVPYRGPFDYIQYNYNILPCIKNGDTLNGEPDINAEVTTTSNGYTVYPKSVHRPLPLAYTGGQSHSTKGVEVELLDDTTPLEGKVWDTATSTWVNAATNTATPVNSVFTNPDVLNKLETASGDRIKVRTDRLRYRVRFRYPVDPLADPAGGTTVNPANHYLVDTPVFDDISIVYFGKVRILDFREAIELGAITPDGTGR